MRPYKSFFWGAFAMSSYANWVALIEPGVQYTGVACTALLVLIGGYTVGRHFGEKSA